MKMTLHGIDEQIREVENRIAIERIALDDAVHACMSSAREALTSPKALLALAGVGFAVGKIVFREKAPPVPRDQAKKAGALGVLTGLAGTALSLVGRGGGGWGSVARWAAGKYLSRKKGARAGAATAPTAKGPTAEELRTAASTSPRPYPKTRVGV
jgi:hypothetical protein